MAETKYKTLADRVVELVYALDYMPLGHRVEKVAELLEADAKAPPAQEPIRETVAEAARRGYHG